MMIKKPLDTVLDAIGETPLVRLDRIALEEGIKCNLYAKCEYFNAGGSVKDRIAYVFQAFLSSDPCEMLIRSPFQ